VDIPDTRYAITEDGVHIAYQVVGDGPVDIVFVHAFVTHLELMWELPSFEQLLRALSSFARVILFDKRGVGLSDRLSSSHPTLEARMDDLRAVLDAARSDRALLFGVSDGGALATLFAATTPERSLGLLLWSGAVRLAWAPDYPWGMRDDDFEDRLRAREGLWGNPRRGEESVTMTFWVDGERLSRDPHFVSWLMRLQRNGAAPGDLATFNRVWLSTDARSALPAIQVPTVVAVRDAWPAELIEESTWTARQIPGASVVTLPGWGEDPYVGDVAPVADAVERFLSSIREEQEVFERVLATVLFTDIIGSTQHASALGDREWKRLVEQHHSRVRALLSRFRGNEVDTAGDGFYATFDGPARAVRCASAIARSVESLGIHVRAGLHTGEVETIAGKAGGLAVVIGARIASLAGPSEILVSQTVRDLTAGSGLTFEELGDRELKGVPGRWRINRVVGAPA
jgi:class 3 adenylate cyclase/alpha-beta hydrolase superfamily lysophospholipase